MWPQTLEMSRDECRGMLRRLELESYSHIISVFRAQGSLSEPKAKLLEELRQLFHITQERHCAEVRRAANDEQLCTIAENVCGPNTWQEWSREGRRPYPLLPRISPQTALSIVANEMAAKAYAENAKLSTPLETGANLSDALREQANYLMLKHGISKVPEPLVVMDEPFKVPDLPNEIKKATLKRKENEAGEAKPNKKRNLQQDRLQLQQNANQFLAKEEDGHLAPLEQRPNARTLQQRYFYQQQQKHKQRLASKKGASNALANHSGITAAANTKPAKSGRRRAQKQLLQQKQQQELQQQLQQQQVQQQQQQLQQQHKVLLSVPEASTQPNSNHLVQPHVEYILDEALKSVAATKLRTLPVKRTLYANTELQSPTIVSSPVGCKEKLIPTVVAAAATTTQQQPQPQQLSTPVKKYIVEERQPTAIVSTANLPLAPQIISVQQIAAAPKVRTSSSSSSSNILQPGSKLTPKKINLQQQLLPSVPNAALRLLAYEGSNKTAAATVATAATAAATTPPGVQKYIVEERVPSQQQQQIQNTTTTTPLSSASAVNIIKNIPASSLNNTLITPVTPVVPVFRKANTTTATAAGTGTGSGTGITAATTAAASTSQLLGNLKLTSGIKHVPSSALRNIKICSPNGKVFLQPAKLHAGSIIHKLNAAATSSNASGSVAVTPTSPQPAQQRITIQKMQLLTSTQVASKVKPTTLTLGTAGGKNNLVFLPTSGMRAVTLATSKPKSSTELLTAKPNVLVIGPANAVNNSQTTAAASSSSSSSTTSMLSKAKSHQLITEDTPIDIINMPIIVADNGTAETPAAKTPVKTAPMVVINATDWEMELDQASKVTTPTGTTATILPNSKKLLEEVIVEEQPQLVVDSSNMQLNNSIIELQQADGSAIEYVDMELEQPIEIESTSNISPETMTSSSSSNTTTTTSNTTTTTKTTNINTPQKLTILSSPTLLEQHQQLELASKVEVVTAAATTTIATSTTTPLP